MCGSMVDIQSATAENRRGKKGKIETAKTASGTQGGHNNAIRYEIRASVDLRRHGGEQFRLTTLRGVRLLQQEVT